ncbi:MAG: M16 family metallopeptidase [Nitrospinota bacterium]
MRAARAPIGAAVALLLILWPASPDASLRIEREVLPNGAVLLVSTQRALPMVVVNLAFRAGAVYEPPGQEGLAGLTASLLLRGTKRWSAGEAAREKDALGGEFGVDVGRELAWVSMRLLTRDLERGFAFLAEALLRPTFPEKEVVQMRQRALDTLQRLEERPSWLANRLFLRTLYGDHPYGRIVKGTRESLQKIGREEVAAFHRSRYGARGSVLALVGDISLARARALVMRHLGEWRPGRAPLERLPEPRPSSRFTVRKLHRPVAQSSIVLGNLGLRRDHPDFYAVRVMNYILGGGGFESRALRAIREERGLAYSVYSYFVGGLHGGFFHFGMQTRNPSANQAIDLALKEIRRIREEPVSERELADAKQFLTGNFPLRFSTNRRIAQLLTSVELFGLGLDYMERYPRLIGAVSRSEVQRVARKYLRPEQMVLAIVGNMEEAKLRY